MPDNGAYGERDAERDVRKALRLVVVAGVLNVIGAVLLVAPR